MHMNQNENEDNGNNFNSSENDSSGGFIPAGPSKKKYLDEMDNLALIKSNTTDQQLAKLIFFIMEERITDFDSNSPKSMARIKHKLDTILYLILILGIPF